MPRDSAKLRQDVLHMRSEMARHKPGKGPLDVKLARGGLVDIEFLTHYLQLHAHVGLIPAIPAALAALVEAGLLAPPIVEAHAALARFLIAARLLAPDSEEPPAAAREVLARACQCGDWEELKANLAAARRTVAASWSAVFGEQLELEP
jgi:glutamate-ammonia-ligase adenylyltransferase